MNVINLESAKSLFDEQLDISIWYAEYDERCETILYVNEKFAEIFALSKLQILKRKRYSLVNPPETSAETIEQYKEQDLEAISQGCFLICREVEPGKEIVVVKLRFDQGVLGLFQIIETESVRNTISLPDLTPELLELVQSVCPNL